MNLEQACEACDLDAVKSLIESGADINYSNNGKSLLHRAVIIQCRPIVEYLIHQNANVNTKTSSGATPLHSAILTQNNTIIKLLIDAKANINSATTMQDTPLHYAVDRNASDIVKILLEAGADTT